MHLLTLTELAYLKHRWGYPTGLIVFNIDLFFMFNYLRHMEMAVLMLLLLTDIEKEINTCTEYH